MAVVKRLCLLSPQISQKHSNAIESSRSRIILEDTDSVPKKDYSPVNPFKRVGRNLSHLKTADRQTTKQSITKAHFLHVSLFYWHRRPVYFHISPRLTKTNTSKEKIKQMSHSELVSPYWDWRCSFTFTIVSFIAKYVGNGNAG